MGRNINKRYEFSFSWFDDFIKSTFFLIGFLIALLFWVVDPFIDAIILKNGNFIRQLTEPDINEIYIRTVFSATVIIICFIGSFLLNRSKQAEEALKTSEKQYRGLLESAPDGMVIVNRKGEIQIINQQLQIMTGYTADELIGQGIEVLIPERYKTHKLLRDNFLKNPRIRMMGEGAELFVRHKDGSEFPTEISLSPLETAGRLTISASIRDITERKQTEEKLRHSQNMEMMGQMAGGIAHDFNNLLTVIMSNLELLKGELGDSLDEDERGIIKDAMTAAQSGAQLTQSLLTISRKQILQPKDTDINTVVKEFVQLTSRIMGGQIKIIISTEEPSLFTYVDPNQLKNALLNLAINSRDAMPYGGALTISTDCETVGTQPDSDQESLDAGDYVVISLTDTGYGMLDGIINRAQEVFFTTKGVGEGTGLGLSSVFGFAKQSGGGVSIKSVPDIGTSVSLYLPKTKPSKSSNLNK